jgi:hypothetical protein
LRYKPGRRVLQKEWDVTEQFVNSLSERKLEMKTRILTIAFACVLIGAGVAASAATVYNCNFEQGSQGAAFTLGGVSGQGAPAWSGYYSSGYDAAGDVVNAAAHSGTQSLYTSGYSTSRVTLAAVTRAPWFEFAFRTNFAGGGNGVPTSRVWMRTTRGSVSDVVGVNMWIYMGESQIMLSTTTGSVSLGANVDQTWNTISFQQDTYVYDGNTYYGGSCNVFLNGAYKGYFAIADSSYNGLGTMVFSTNSPSWTENGALFVDDIHVGDTSAFVPEPGSLLALGMGLVGMAGAVLRKRS